MTPQYESNQDREREDRCAWILENLGYTVEQTSTLSHYDFKLSKNGNVRAIAEYKHRDKLYDPQYVDEKKVQAMISAAEEHNAKPILIIQGPDGPYRFTELRPDYGTKPFTRTKGDRGDREHQVCVIPLSEFETI